MVSFLPLLMGFKQCFDNLGTKLTDYLKCRSNCCYQVNVYNPKNCAVMGGISNRWIRSITPECVKGKESSIDSFKTPKS
jgi:hypothetical protein